MRRQRDAEDPRKPLQVSCGIIPGAVSSWIALILSIFKRSSGTRSVRGYRQAETGAVALKSAVWEMMIVQRPSRLAIRKLT